MTKLAMFALALFAPLSHAATIVVDLYPSTILLGAGETAAVSAVITNLENATVDLNGIQITLSGPISGDDTPFFINAPLSIGPLATTFNFVLFTVSAAALAPASGLLPATVSILGGIEGPAGYDPGAQDILGQQDFSVVITPEPAAWILATPITLLLWRRRPCR
jgi:hypothetical protein